MPGRSPRNPRQLADALAATELVLAREQHLSQLDGLAAAAAHELGTPLATITVIARELQLALKPDSEHADDVRLLNEQAQRCRGILGKLTELSSGDPFDRMKLSTLIEEVVAPHRNFGVAINVALAAGDVAEPVGGRNPAILYGLGNLLENAVDFARERVEVAASWSGEDVAVTIIDDGPGFAPEIMDRIGEPYVTSRRRRAPERRRRGRAGSASASSSPRPCWSDRAPRSTSRTVHFPSAGPWCGCDGAAAISSARSPSHLRPAALTIAEPAAHQPARHTLALFTCDCRLQFLG